MKQLSLFLLMISSVSFTQTGSPAGTGYLYLQNQRTEKIKKINLKSTYELTYTVDSTADNFYSHRSWQCFEPAKVRFKADGISFPFSAENYDFWKQGSELESTDNWTKIYEYDTSAFLPYTDQTTGYNIYLSRQSKAGRILFAAGVGIVYAALVNAFFVAPLRGLNAGGFEGYNMNRLWRGELCSGIGIAVGLPIMFIFDRKDYYFQDPAETWDTWKVVDPHF